MYIYPLPIDQHSENELASFFATLESKAYSWDEIQHKLKSDDYDYIDQYIIPADTHTALGECLLSFVEYVGANDLVIDDITYNKGTFVIFIISSYSTYEVYLHPDHAIAIERESKDGYMHYDTSEQTWAMLEFLAKEMK